MVKDARLAPVGAMLDADVMQHEKRPPAELGRETPGGFLDIRHMIGDLDDGRDSDGPGQGESNLAGIDLLPGSYEQAATAALDVLLQQPEVDGSRVGVYGLSFGSHWALRFAAQDPRISAVSLTWATLADKRHLMDEESPRWKRMFAYLTGADSEAQLDEFVAQMTDLPSAAALQCPAFMTIGEYDPRSPLPEIYEVYDAISSPKDLWVFSDQHHMCQLNPRPDVAIWGLDTHDFSIDWLVDRFAGVPVKDSGRTVYVEAGKGSPNGAAATKARWWWEAARP